MKTDLLGLKINTETRAQILAEIKKRLEKREKTFIVTPYSEFFHKTYFDQEFKEILNSADYALPDGISVLWLSYYLYMPLTLKNYYLKIIQAFWQIFRTGFAAIFNKKLIKIIVPEKISGSDFFWDLAALASENGYSIFLLGGFGDTPEAVAEKLRKKFPKIKIAGYSNRGPSDLSVIEKINNAKCDILMVAYGPEKQERWIYENKNKFAATVAIGLGGTFDYVAGKKRFAPKFIRSAGFEWLYRLLTQPKRATRIFHATLGFLNGALRYKVFANMPFRENAASVIINRENKILLAHRSVEKQNMDFPGTEHWQIPQGGIERGEMPEKAVLREMKEGLGTDKFEIIGKMEKAYEYNWNLAREKFFSRYTKTRGQRQTIFFLKFTGEDKDIKLDQREFSDYKWFTTEEIENKIYKARLPMFKLAMEKFKELKK